MKRVLLLIAFFVGLMPNLKEMNLECVNSVVGQSMYGEDPNNYPFDKCDEGLESCFFCGNCYGLDNYCTECYNYCSVCRTRYLKTDTHKHDDDESNNNNNDDSSNNNNNSSSNNNSSVTYYYCVICGQKFITKAKADEHIRLFISHRIIHY